MSVEASLPLPTEVDRLVRVPMAFEDYVALPEWHRAEYVDGYAIVSPSAIASHQRISRRLANVIEQYGIVDREHRTLTALVAAGSGWDVLVDLDDDRMSGTVLSVRPASTAAS